MSNRVIFNLNDFPVMNMSRDEPPHVKQLNCMVTTDEVQKLINTVFILNKRIDELEKLVVNKPISEKSVWGYSL